MEVCHCGRVRCSEVDRFGDFGTAARSQVSLIRVLFLIAAANNGRSVDIPAAVGRILHTMKSNF